MMVAVACLLLVLTWMVGCVWGWHGTWRRRGGQFNWRVFLGPGVYGRWWHEVNERYG
jgi:hypothetical protein